jgi:hypothetical protein
VSNPFRTRLHAEALDARITPSVTVDGLPAFNGLSVAASQFAPVDPCLVISPVFAQNYGQASRETVPALAGLSVASNLVPPNPTSPVFAVLDGGGVDTPL